jgi:serine/threonine protein kinase
MSAGNVTDDLEGRSGLGPVVPVIPEHTLLRKIGKGSYGEIWLARSALGAYRAVKIIHQTALQDHAGAYEREFAGTARFEPISRQHEGLVQILQFGRGSASRGEFFYYVMELADNVSRHSVPTPSPSDPAFPDQYVPRTLAYELVTRSPLPVAEVRDLGERLGQALEFLHSQSLVHRDLKPSNIIFVGGVPKLADVGCVADLDNSLSAAGTIGYMPSEGPSTISADLFSVGKVLYEAATGKDRQDFPDLPTSLISGNSKPLLELNEIWLKACANNPAERYDSAARFLSDLEKLREGKSLRHARVRQRQLVVAVGALVLTIAVCTVAWLLRSRVVLADDFDGSRLRKDLWSWSTKEWPGYGSTGHRQFRIEQTNGEFILEAKAQSEGGWSTHGAAWLDTKQDLRTCGECRVEIELTGTNRLSLSALSISDGQEPAEPEDSQAVRLLAMPGGEKDSILRNHPWPLEHQQVRIDLLPSHQAAVVYPDAKILDLYEIADLSRLTHWRLRFYAVANSSAVNPDGLAQFRIKQITVTAQPAPGTIVGHVTDSLTGRPIADATIQGDSEVRLAKTLQNGAFKLTTPQSSSRLFVEHDGYLPSDVQQVSRDTARHGPLKIELRKRAFAYGDVVGAIPYTNNRNPIIGIWETNLCALFNEGDGTAAQSVVHPVDVSTKKLLPAIARYPTDNHPLGFFAQCGERILATRIHPSGSEVCELDLAGGKFMPILSPRTPEGRPIVWLAGCAYDGEHLWFVESDDLTNWFGLRAADLESRTITHSIPNGGDKLIGLAWDAGQKQFWVSDPDKHLVYPVDRDKALVEGKLEPARGRQFSGTFRSLAYQDGYLWGVDTERKRICKIKIRD